MWIRWFCSLLTASVACQVSSSLPVAGAGDPPGQMATLAPMEIWRGRQVSYVTRGHGPVSVAAGDSQSGVSAVPTARPVLWLTDDELFDLIATGRGVQPSPVPNRQPTTGSPDVEAPRSEAEGQAQPTGGQEGVSRSVNSELNSISRGFRSLDQSFAIRGYRGAAAATAGSVYIDWKSKGIDVPPGLVVMPPSPIMLSPPKRRCCVPGPHGPCDICHPGSTGLRPHPEHDSLPPAPSRDGHDPQQLVPTLPGVTDPTPAISPR
jgi:hypothetical protein